MAKFQRAVPRVKPPLLDINPVLVCLHCVVAVLCMDDAIKYELSLSLSAIAASSACSWSGFNGFWFASNPNQQKFTGLVRLGLTRLGGGFKCAPGWVGLLV